MAQENSQYGWNKDMDQSLLLKLRADLKTAMRAKDVTVRDAIRQVMSEFPKLTVPLTLESGKKSSRLKKEEEMTDDDLLSIIQGLVKSEKTVLEFKKETSSEYLEILQNYLPAMADQQAIKAWIGENIDLGSLKNSMQAIGPIMKHFGKSADGNMVKAILKEMAG